MLRTALPGLALALSGCLVDGRGGPGDGPCDPGFVRDEGLCVEATGAFDVSWDPDPNCPDGATTAQVVSVDDTGAEVVDLYWCEDFAGLTGPLALGSYDVFVNLTDTDELGLFAQSFIEQAELAALDDVAVLDFAFPADVAFLGAGWTVMPDCQAAGIAAVELHDEVRGVLGGAACDAGALVLELELGAYKVHLQGLASDGESVVATSPVLSTELEFGNQLAELDGFEL